MIPEQAAPAVRRAGLADLERLLPLVAEFCAVDGHDYDEGRVRAALRPLLADDGIGQVWVLDSGGDTGDEPALGGYGVITWGWSLESGGRDALLDELYVRDRNQGHGATLMDAVLTAAGAAGASRMFLETEDANAAVRRFYRRHGFEEERSVWMQRALRRVGDGSVIGR